MLEIGLVNIHTSMGYFFNQVEEEACLSKSIRLVLIPCLRTKKAAKLAAMVLLPTPPFWLHTKIFTVFTWSQRLFKVVLCCTAWCTGMTIAVLYCNLKSFVYLAWFCHWKVWRTLFLWIQSGWAKPQTCLALLDLKNTQRLISIKADKNFHFFCQK